MSKFGKNLLEKIIGSNKSCCCGGSSIVSLKKISVEGKDVYIAGLDEEFEKCLTAGKTPVDVDGEELLRNILHMNEISKNEMNLFKAPILKEYATYWQENKS